MIVGMNTENVMTMIGGFEDGTTTLYVAIHLPESILDTHLMRDQIPYHPPQTVAVVCLVRIGDRARLIRGIMIQPGVRQ